MTAMITEKMVAEKMIAQKMDPLAPENFPPGTSPYTLAIAKCISESLCRSPNANAAPDPESHHALMNLVQGRMLEYLADRICREFDIRDSVLRGRMVSVLMGIFSDEFFAVFRRKIRLEPDLVMQIARRIIRKEAHPTPLDKLPPNRQSADRLYPAIFRKYFEYRDLEALLDMLESDGEIQKIVIGSLLKARLGDALLYRRILALLDEDGEGVTPSLFMGYIKGNGIDFLIAMVESGDWTSERIRLKARLDHLRGD